MGHRNSVPLFKNINKKIIQPRLNCKELGTGSGIKLRNQHYCIFFLFYPKIELHIVYFFIPVSRRRRISSLEYITPAAKVLSLNPGNLSGTYRGIILEEGEENMSYSLNIFLFLSGYKYKQNLYST